MAYGYDPYPPEYDLPDGCQECGKDFDDPEGDPEALICDECDCKSRIDPMENGDYVGNEEDGVYTDYAKGSQGVYFRSVVDINSGACFCDEFGSSEYILFKDDPLATFLGRLNEAADYCMEMGIGIDFDDLTRYRSDATKDLDFMCPQCRGVGDDPSVGASCNKCDGSGVVA